MALGFLKLVPDPLTFDHNPIALLLHMVQQESIDENLEETLIIITTNKGATDTKII
jgi:hypothetical protein